VFRVRRLQRTTDAHASRFAMANGQLFSAAARGGFASRSKKAGLMPSGPKREFLEKNRRLLSDFIGRRFLFS